MIDLCLDYLHRPKHFPPLSLPSLLRVYRKAEAGKLKELSAQACGAVARKTKAPKAPRGKRAPQAYQAPKKAKGK